MSTHYVSVRLRLFVYLAIALAWSEHLELYQRSSPHFQTRGKSRRQMKTHLPEIINPQQISRQGSTSTLVVLEHNATRSSIPLLRALLSTYPKRKREGSHTLVVCLLHAPSILITDASQDGHLRMLDLTGRISNFGSESDATSEAPRTSNDVLTAIREG